MVKLGVFLAMTLKCSKLLVLKNERYNCFGGLKIPLHRAHSTINGKIDN